jgi:hypothetical protein
VVPILVPLIITDALGMGFPAASVTFPEITLFCACSCAHSNAMHKNMERDFFVIRCQF